MIKVNGLAEDALSQGTNEHSDLSSATYADIAKPRHQQAEARTIDRAQRKRVLRLALQYGAVLLFIIVSELLYREPLYVLSVERLIPRLQHAIDRIGLLTNIYYLGEGSELLVLFLYHMIISGKYHRAFLVSIFISQCFLVTQVLQLWYG